MSIILSIRWSPGIICTVMPTGLYTLVGWRQVSWFILGKAKMGAGEGTRYLVLRQNHTRVQ